MRVVFSWPTRPLNALCFAIAAAGTIREQIADLTDRAQAIYDLAAEEERELTPDEKTEIDSILGSGKPGEAGYKAGKIDALENDLQRAEKLEAKQAELAKNRQTVPFARADGPQGRKPTGDEQESQEVRAASIVVPRDAMFSHSRLTAFKGQHARQEAYLVGQFLLATLFDHGESKKWCQDHGVDIQFRAALSGGTNTAGGYLVPTEMETAIIELREVYGVFRRNAEVVPMMSDTKNQPYVKTDLEASFVGENEESDESDPVWGNAQLVAKKVSAITRYSSEVSEDAVISIADALTRQFARAFALKEDRCGFLGNGTSTYGGIVGLASALNAGSVHTALAGNVTFGTLDLEDFEATMGLLPEFAGSDPRWFVSKPGWANAMLRLAAAAGGNTIETLSNGMRQKMFLGYPVEIVQVLPKALTGTTSTRLLYFGDLRQAALLGSRRGMTLRQSDQRYFEYDQIGMMGTERFDIVVHSTGTASEAGAIVALETPGT